MIVICTLTKIDKTNKIEDRLVLKHKHSADLNGMCIPLEMEQKPTLIERESDDKAPLLWGKKMLSGDKALQQFEKKLPITN
jgi:hypothetical protein